MNLIGAIGSRTLRDLIMFEVSSERVLTFKNLTRRNSVRFAKHDTLLRKPVSQYIGPDLDNLSLKIILDTQWGVSPREEYNKLMRIQQNGQLVIILIGWTVLGSFRFRIDNLGILKSLVDHRGTVLRAEVDINFEEYAR